MLTNNLHTLTHLGRIPRRRLLMIDSEAVLCWLLCEVLERAGFDVTVETRGDRAIAATDDGPFDVVVVDRATPGIDGLDLLTYVRHRFPDTPILFVTAVEGALIAQAARERGATACIEKPSHVEDLVRAITRLADGGALPSDGVPALPGERRDPDERAGACGHGAAGPMWGVVLAGGQGTRLRPLVRHIHGKPRPKQYARIAGTRSLLRRTLDRVALAVPGQRTVVVSVHGHARYLGEESAHGVLPTMLMQPRDRGTAAAVLLSASWIHRRDPDATIAVFPSDHFVASAQPFMEHVRDVATFVESRPERIVLVGATPTEPETDYGWIEPGETEGGAGKVVIRAVRRFVEKPTRAGATECLDAGALWNTFVMVGRAVTLVEAARQLVPDLYAALAGAVPLIGTSLGRSALRRAYDAVPSQSFSSAVLEHCPALLGVSTLDGTDWCDWGSPRRVIRTLRRSGIAPGWLRAAEGAGLPEQSAVPPAGNGGALHGAAARDRGRAD